MDCESSEEETRLILAWDCNDRGLLGQPGLTLETSCTPDVVKLCGWITWPESFTDSAISLVEPSNDHELVIALIVDRIALQGKLRVSAIEDVIAVLDFTMSKSDTEFLVIYLRWRMDNPIAK